jgi:transcription antitermination protein NusB
MKKDKREIRIEVMNNLYQYDLYHSEALAFIPSFDIEEAKELYEQVISKLELIDQTIENNLFDYKLYRLSFLDRAIIRLAVYELKFTQLAKAIVIDEAIELTKLYTDLDDQKQHRFNNKLLDNIHKSLKG